MKSGSSLSPWAVRTQNTRLNSQFLAEHVGCRSFVANQNLTYRMLECLQDSELSRLNSAQFEIRRRDVEYTDTGEGQVKMIYLSLFLSSIYVSI